MYIRKTTRVYQGKSYTNHLLVESVLTVKGPRQRTICSLGSLEPAPAEQWRVLAHKLESALQGQRSLSPSLTPPPLQLAHARQGRKQRRAFGTVGRPATSLVLIATERIATEEHREAGCVDVGHQLWRQLDMDRILGRGELSKRACLLSEAMTLNRLIFPLSEHAMPDWNRRTALADIVGEDFSLLNEDALYSNLDKLYPNRKRIERELGKRETMLFKLDDTLYLYDLTSSYFEGQAKRNPQAKRGYSRDQRPDCKQVVVGLVLDREGFPKAHEIFDGNVQDRPTGDAMLSLLESRSGKKPGSTVIVDRGMAYGENLKQIRERGHHYIVAGRQPERNEWLDDIEDEQGWEEVIRVPSPRNSLQKKSSVQVKRRIKEGEVYVLCLSEGREEKDCAFREKQEQRLIDDLEGLKARLAKGQLKRSEKIHEAIGRLKERYPCVARYYRIAYDAEHNRVGWQEDTEKKAMATKLDGSYVLKTDRQDLTADEIWCTYVLLTRVESVFRSMKSPLMERPIFHHLKNRT